MGDNASGSPDLGLSILVVSYNTKEMTCTCIRSVYEQAQASDFEVIVVDNTSSDGSADAIAAEFPQVNLIRSPENLGFARANNLAAACARADYLLLLNPDTVILDNAIDRLRAFSKAHPSARICGGRTFFADGTLNPGSCWGFMSLWSLFALSTGLTALFRNSEILNREGYGGWQRDRVREVDIVTGCFFLIDRDLWNSLGGFDESFFMYGEEADLCYRAHKLGAHPTITPEATIIHHGGASEKVLSDKTVRLHSGKVHFLRKHWRRPKLDLGVALLRLHTLIRAVGFQIAGFLSGSEKHKAAAREWASVWSRRGEWSTGYQER